MSRGLSKVSPAQRDAIRHMLIAGVRRRDIAHGISIDPRRAEARFRKPRASEVRK